MVEDEDELLEKKAKLEAAGVDVIGPTDHGFCKSIYFHDPSGHRLELTTDAEDDELRAKLLSSAHSILDHWDQHRVAPEVDALHLTARDG